MTQMDEAKIVRRIAPVLSIGRQDIRKEACPPSRKTN